MHIFEVSSLLEIGMGIMAWRPGMAIELVSIESHDLPVPASRLRVFFFEFTGLNGQAGHWRDTWTDVITITKKMAYQGPA